VGGWVGFQTPKSDLCLAVFKTNPAAHSQWCLVGAFSKGFDVGEGFVVMRMRLVFIRVVVCVRSWWCSRNLEVDVGGSVTFFTGYICLAGFCFLKVLFS
tara:strand:+ start:32739 stop:33035 length:297 start_codon:yes stop_codon:yes gene_type:complete